MYKTTHVCGCRKDSNFWGCDLLQRWSWNAIYVLQHITNTGLLCVGDPLCFYPLPFVV